MNKEELLNLIKTDLQNGNITEEDIQGILKIKSEESNLIENNLQGDDRSHLKSHKLINIIPNFTFFFRIIRKFWRSFANSYVRNSFILYRLIDCWWNFKNDNW